MIEHPLEPIIDEQCEVLILGSFPSVKSREISFYYGHPQNRFWKIIGTITQTDYETIEDKKKMLLEHHIAIWDIIHSCTIIGSSDASIKDVVPNDIKTLIQGTNIKRIYCNGGTSLKLYKKYHLLFGTLHSIPLSIPIFAYEYLLLYQFHLQMQALPM